MPDSDPLQLPRARRLAARVAAGLRLRVGGGRPVPVPPGRVHVVGSVRRGEPATGDLDFLIVLPDRLAAQLAELPYEWVPPGAGAGVLARGPWRQSLLLRVPGRLPVQADFFLAAESEEPYALFHHTGSRAYNIRTRAHAKRRGWQLNQHGLFEAASGRRVPGSEKIRTEADLARFLGVSVRAPSERGR